MHPCRFLFMIRLHIHVSTSAATPGVVYFQFSAVRLIPISTAVRALVRWLAHRRHAPAVKFMAHGFRELRLGLWPARAAIAIAENRYTRHVVGTDGIFKSV